VVVPDALGRDLLAEVRRRVDAIMAEAATVTVHKRFPFLAELTCKRGRQLYCV
jgi:hypothetical protein